ncbi:hypothetical protein [Mesorhizobium cantuariense]|uniref:Uncharacterized protein n=1 Tax=Mesorhizobium cantuariense TaxID=1300275 RepID=A0ABV7MVT3_9HYPH
MKISKLTFQGTAAEFEAVRSQFADSPVIETVEATTADEGGRQGEQRTIELMRRVIQRTGLAPNHSRMLKAMAGAGDGGLTKTELVGAMAMTEDQFKGVIGSFGRRTSNTPGWPKEVQFYNWKWDKEVDEWRYWIDEPFRSAIAKLI